MIMHQLYNDNQESFVTYITIINNLTTSSASRMQISEILPREWRYQTWNRQYQTGSVKEETMILRTGDEFLQRG